MAKAAAAVDDEDHPRANACRVGDGGRAADPQQSPIARASPQIEHARGSRHRVGPVFRVGSLHEAPVEEADAPGMLAFGPEPRRCHILVNLGAAIASDRVFHHADLRSGDLDHPGEQRARFGLGDRNLGTEQRRPGHRPHHAVDFQSAPLGIDRLRLEQLDRVLGAGAEDAVGLQRLASAAFGNSQIGQFLLNGPDDIGRSPALADGNSRI